MDGVACDRSHSSPWISYLHQVRPEPRLASAIIKIAARAVEMKTMIRMHLPASHPAQDILRLALD